MNDEFYIGWQDKAPVRTGRMVHRVVAALFIIGLAAAAGVAVAQRTIGRSVFEWGQVKEFTGVLRSAPVPHLFVEHDGTNQSATHYLVNPWKFGFDPELARRFDGQQVTLRGTRIYRDDQMMIEVVPGSVATSTNSPPPSSTSAPATTSLGRQTFRGEIVDSKCFLGVMNPGQLKPHRACAVRCISGGVPPVLLVRQADGTARYLLLVSGDGQPVNKQVLDMVAEPVEITGEVVRQGELLALRAAPATYRRVKAP